MPQATFVIDGQHIDYTPTTAVAAGEVVVLGDLIGVAKSPIAANTRGALTVMGVFDFAKATGTAFPPGTIVYWDNTNKVVTATPTGNKLLGKVVRAAFPSDTTVRVRLQQ